MSTTVKSFSNENEFEAYLRGFTKSHYEVQSSHNEAISKLAVGKRDWLDQQIAKAAEIAAALLADENAAYLATSLTTRKIPRQRADANPYLPITRLLFGDWFNSDPEKQKLGIKGDVWKPDRSAEKYANYLRYFRDEGTKPADIPAKIAETKGRLQAIERCDRQRYRKKDPDLREVDDAIDELKQQAPLATFPLSKLKSDTKLTQGVVWFNVVDGEVRVMGLVKSSDEGMEALLNRLAKPRKSELLRKRKDRLEAAKKKSTQAAVTAVHSADKSSLVPAG